MKQLWQCHSYKKGHRLVNAVHLSFGYLILLGFSNEQALQALITSLHY
jgi:hypothetical protein